MVPQVRKFTVFGSCAFTNASSDYALGLENFNLDCNYNPMKAILTEFKNTYEQYRIRQVRIRCQVGKGYTNDRRLKTIVGCRVDKDDQLTGATLANVQAINASENTVMRTMTERGNVMLANFRPVCRKRVGGAASDDPILPNNLNWFMLANAYDHLWKGCTVTVMLPETTLSPDEVALTIMQEVVVEFRGRVSNHSIFSLSDALEQAPEDILPTYDLTETQFDLRDKLLSGVYFPISPNFPSIPTIGSTATAEQMIGAVFREQVTQKKYGILVYADGLYSANIVI